MSLYSRKDNRMPDWLLWLDIRAYQSNSTVRTQSPPINTGVNKKENIIMRIWHTHMYLEPPVDIQSIPDGQTIGANYCVYAIPKETPTDGDFGYSDNKMLFRGQSDILYEVKTQNAIEYPIYMTTFHYDVWQHFNPPIPVVWEQLYMSYSSNDPNDHGASEGSMRIYYDLYKCTEQEMKFLMSAFALPTKVHQIT